MDWKTTLILAFEALAPIIFACLAKNTELTRISLNEIKDLRHNVNDGQTVQQAWINEITQTVKRNSEAIDKLLIMMDSTVNKKGE